jgi:hypothetical protein
MGFIRSRGTPCRQALANWALIRLDQLQTSRCALVFYSLKCNPRRSVCGCVRDLKSASLLDALEEVVRVKRGSKLIPRTGALTPFLAKQLFSFDQHTIRTHLRGGQFFLGLQGDATDSEVSVDAITQGSAGPVERCHDP